MLRRPGQTASHQDRRRHRQRSGDRDSWRSGSD